MPERTLPPRYVSIQALRDGLDLAARSVCAIEGAGSSNGTGVLVGANLVLTNHHVVDALITTNDFSSAECRFDYFDAEDGLGPQPGKTVAIREVVHFSRPSPGDVVGGGDAFDPARLDYAVVRLAEPVGRQACPDAPARGWVTLQKRPPDLVFGPIFVVQHPGGRGWIRDQRAMCVATGDLIDETPDGARLLHDAKTEPGSSGSPCFDEDGFNFIGLHNSRDGAPESERRRAIPIHLIVQHLRANCPTYHQFIGAAPPPPPPKIDPAKLAEQRAKVVDARRRAAFCLMDRSTEESRFLALLRSSAPQPAPPPAAKPTLNVIVCRPGDAPEYFLDRLRYLSFSAAGAAKAASWLDALKRGLADPTRAVTVASWPDAADPDGRRPELDARLDELDVKAHHLLVLRRSIDESWSEATERDLLGYFAGRLAEAFKDNPDGVQCVVAFVAPDGPEGSALAARFAAMWSRDDAPPHCGFCLRLRDIASDDLIEWRDYLDNAWGRSDAFHAAIDDLFAAETRQPLGRVARALQAGLTKCIEDALDASNWRPEALR